MERRNTDLGAATRCAGALAMGAWMLAGRAATPAPLPIETYGRLPAIEEARLSPAGDHIAIIGVAGEERRLLVLTPDGKGVKTGVLGDAKVRDLDWAGDKHLLVTSSGTFQWRPGFGDKFELAEVIHVGLDDARPWMVFGNSDLIAHTTRGYYGAAQREGHWYGYFGGITQREAGDQIIMDHGYADLYRVNLDTGQPHLEASGSARAHEWVLDGGGAVVAHSDFDDASGRWRLFAGTGTARALMQGEPDREIELAGLGRTPGTVAVEERIDGVASYREVNLADGGSQPLFEGKTVVAPLHDPVTRRLVGAILATGAEFLDPALQARFEATKRALKGLRVELVSFTPGLDRLIVHTDGALDSGTYFYFDLTAHKAQALRYEYPDIKPQYVGPTRRFEYTARDGLAMDAVLTLPPDREPKALPVIVMPHGGPMDVWDTVGFDWWAQALASRGYAVLQPNYRGSGLHGAAFREAGFGEWGRKMLSDIADGLDALVKQGIADPQRACIVGASYGGYAALAGVTLQHGLYRCAVSVAGVSDLATFGEWQSGHYGARSAVLRFIRRLTGEASEGPGILPTISPAAHAAQADAPVLLIHGRDDTRVPIAQSEEMAKRLKEAGKTVEFVELPREDHFLSREATRVAMLEATAAFLAKYDPTQ